jgi:hypothetical protein
LLSGRLVGPKIGAWKLALAASEARPAMGSRGAIAEELEAVETPYGRREINGRAELR